MINYHQKYLETINSLNDKKRLLLHSCCAPCSSTCLERLTKYFSVDVYFYNPNITSINEYEKRLSEQVRLVDLVYKNEVNVINATYNKDEFLSAVKGLEDLPEKSSRCKNCYLLRLEKTAKYAKENGYDYFTTTLTLSPHKNAEWINEIGIELQEKYGVKFLCADFKKEGGYLRSIELSKKYNLYRQNYCGCEFSKRL